METDLIQPGLPWLDDRGRHIQAHGGGIIKLGDTWFWFGEDRSRDNDPAKRFVACYSSTDLTHWRFRNQVIALTDPANLGPRWVLERPKAYFNARSGKFVLYMHLDGRPPGSDSPYGLACVAVATCGTVDGDYQYIRHFRPFGLESRDIDQFVDDDGAPYLIFESRPTGGFYIASLTADCLDVDRQVCFIKAPLEGGAIVNYEGLYYILGSALTGWFPNPNKYATATRLEGPWSAFRDIAHPNTLTWNSQSTNLIKVSGTERTTVIYAGDRWRPEEQWDSRYVWMPLEIGGGQMQLSAPKPWALDVRTGAVAVRNEISWY